ncbi:hypothetical protein DFP73DRAFT_599159 [Morchella snyderi]|nr:hypothetical protein DFP73DRAFT_599159 [Morchella snyderi]
MSAPGPVRTPANRATQQTPYSPRLQNSQTLGRSQQQRGQHVIGAQRGQNRARPQSSQTQTQTQSQSQSQYASGSQQAYSQVVPQTQLLTPVHNRIVRDLHGSLPLGRGTIDTALSNWDAGFENDDQDENNGSEDMPIQEATFNIVAPTNRTIEELQNVIDTFLYSGDISTARPKRRYDSKKLDAELNDGGELWARLIHSVRMQFCRFLHLADEAIPGVIHEAAKKQVDTNSDGYHKAYTRCLQWRKNWFSLYMIEVDKMQRTIEENNRGYIALTGRNLRDAYGSQFNYENFYALMGTTRAPVDWRKTLESKPVSALYKTIFTYSMIYVHMSRHSPGVFNRTKAMDCIRLIAVNQKFSDVKVGDLVMLPAKPASKVRHRKPKPTDILEIDNDFEPFEDESEPQGNNRINNTTGSAAPLFNGPRHNYDDDDEEVIITNVTVSDSPHFEETQYPTTIPESQLSQ